VDSYGTEKRYTERKQTPRGFHLRWKIKVENSGGKFRWKIKIKVEN
jgi:hypothetical protein